MGELDGPRLGWMAIEEAGDIGEKDEERVAKQRGHEGCQLVVVTKARAQLSGADRIILVDYGHGTIFQQRPQRIANVQIAGAILEILGHQQHLGDMPAAAAEGAFPGFDQGALADCGHRLETGQFNGPSGQADAAHASSNSA